jgi:hypothetical protein
MSQPPGTAPAAPAASPLDTAASGFRVFAWGLAAVFFFLAWNHKRHGG